MIPKNIKILLADDDKADCMLFKYALEELPVLAKLTIVHNGVQVIDELTNPDNVMPDVLFLDIYMPKKNGFATLGEIKRNTALQDLPVIIISTSTEIEEMKQVYNDAAHYYICKPVQFWELKKAIYEALCLVSQKDHPLPLAKNFMITGRSVIIPNGNDLT